MPQTLRLEAGSAVSLGASWVGHKANFTIYAPGAKSLTLGLFEPGETQPFETFELQSLQHRTGDVFHAAIDAPRAQWIYAYQVSTGDGKSATTSDWLLDPYASAISGREQWSCQPIPGNSLRRGLLRHSSFDWRGTPHPRTSWHETIIYELHVRGFTRGLPNTAGIEAGTYAALAERIPYLLDLGISAVEFLPVFEFEEDLVRRYQPQSKTPPLNY